ncbi:MAG TPA: hypothetical protein VKE98_12190 [Gemmataceae bacterium]|nr:hypothetical protein [Gemmataceae bacterium]
MDTKIQPVKLRRLSISSIVLGIVGGLFFWWVPFGMVVSMAGLTVGFVDWVSARRRSLDFRLSIAGMLISAATLALDIIIALNGWQLLTLRGPQ